MDPVEFVLTLITQFVRVTMLLWSCRTRPPPPILGVGQYSYPIRADSGDVIGDALLEVVDGGEGEVGSQGFDGGVGGPFGGDGYIGDTLDEGGDGVDDPAHPGLIGDDGFAGSGGEDGEVGAHDLLGGVGRPGPLGDGDAGLVDPVVEPHEGDPGEGAEDSAALGICIVGWQDRSIIRW